MKTVALVIIYNHQYNCNIEILEQIYGTRFSHIYHLVPFYDGEKENVIAVYENSYYFQGYVAQGFKIFGRDSFDHYLFIADDLVLNPMIDEYNYDSHFKLNDDTCYISRLSTPADNSSYWNMNVAATLYNVGNPGIEVEKQLPSFDEALRRFKMFKLVHKPLAFDQLWEKPSTTKGWLRNVTAEKFYTARFIRNKFFRKPYPLSYPLARSYSDIFVLSADAIKTFCHYCGVFAATNLFSELAIPTAMVLAAKAIATERDLELKGRALWTKNDLTVLDKFENQLEKLLSDFPPAYLYLHPVKLSRWNTNL